MLNAFSKLTLRHLPFLALLAMAAVSRFVVLFLSQTHVHNNEANPLIFETKEKLAVSGEIFGFFDVCSG